MRTRPKVSVLMPVYNAADFVAEAAQSILGQTFADFEFVVIDDGSTDTSSAIIESYAKRDPRIRFLRNGRNLGIVSTLNRGLAVAAGEYVARMDADDISLPQRLGRQVAFLEKRRGISILGTFFCRLGDDRVVKLPESHDEIKGSLFFGTTLCHPTVMMRKEDLRRRGLFYRSVYPHVEDRDLWIRAAKYLRLANLPEALLWRRSHQDQIEKRLADVQQKVKFRLVADLVKRLGIVVTAQQLVVHDLVARGHRFRSDTEREKVYSWLRLLGEKNRQEEVCRPSLFSGILFKLWLGLCRRSGWWGIRGGKETLAMAADVFVELLKR